MQTTEARRKQPGTKHALSRLPWASRGNQTNVAWITSRKLHKILLFQTFFHHNQDNIHDINSSPFHLQEKYAAPSKAFSSQRGQTLQESHQGLCYYQSNYQRKCLHETMRYDTTDPKVKPVGTFSSKQIIRDFVLPAGKEKRRPELVIWIY